MRNVLTTLLSVTLLLACSRERKADAPGSEPKADSVAPESNPAVFQARFERGIDFAATGNEPFWSLDIDLDGSMHFKLMDGLEITAPTPEGVKAMDADVTRYAAKSDQGSMVAQLIRQECTDGMSGAKSEFTVIVEILAEANASPSTYEGCGRYLADNRLNDSWTLESINNNPLDSADFMKGLPQLEFNLADKRVTGHTGCNTITGAIEVQGHRIVFKPMIATKMACPGMEFEHDYLRNFTGNVGYRVEAGKLHLQVSLDSTYTYQTTR
jgi:heat shock protein HslJ